MLGLPFQLDLQPSFYTGFARNEFESAYPGSWRGLVGAWVPALGPTGITLRDVSGFSKHGTLTNMDPATDWIIGGNPRMPGYSLDFGADDDRVPCGDFSQIVGTAPFSVMVWFKTDTATGSGADNYIVGTETNNGWYLRLEDGSPAGRVVVKIDDGANDAFVFDTMGGYADNLWHQLTLVWDTAKIEGFVDGKSFGTDSQANVGAFSGNTVTIGATPAGGTWNFFNGEIGVVYVWNNRVMILPEIQLLNQNPLAPFILRPQLFVRAPAAVGGVIPPRSIPRAVLRGVTRAAA